MLGLTLHMPEKSIYEQSRLERAYGHITADADFLTQFAVLGLRDHMLKHKRVLDIGSGVHNRFKHESQQLFPTMSLITVNPQLAEPALMLARGLLPEEHSGSVAALAQGQLPFAPESFDTVVSCMGVPKYLFHSELPELLNDVWRILKPGGIAKFWPFNAMLDDQQAHMDTTCDTRYVDVELVPDQILALLPDEFQIATDRLVMTKPMQASSELPTVVAELEPCGD